VRPWLTSGRLLPGLTVRRLLTATPAARPQNKTTSAETADNAGTPQSKLLVMENIKEFPRGINSDQVISKEPATAGNQRAPGPGLKQQAPSSKHQASSAKLVKHQATSFKPQATSFKLQAASIKLLDPGPFVKFHDTRTEGLYHDKTILWMLDMERNLVW